MDRVIIQSAVTKQKHRRLYDWWTNGQGDKGAVVRMALEWFLDIGPKLDRIERMLKVLVEREKDNADN